MSKQRQKAEAAPIGDYEKDDYLFVHELFVKNDDRTQAIFLDEGLVEQTLIKMSFHRLLCSETMIRLLFKFVSVISKSNST